MTTRRTPAPRKRPTAVPAAVGARAVPVAQAPADAGSDALQDGVDQIAREFEVTLSQDASLDADQRAAIAEQFGAALQQQLDAGPGLPTLPDRREWTDTVDGLKRSGALSESDAAELIRQLDEAFTQFERHETKLAIEFSRRLATDGEASAMAWLREQQAQSAEDTAAAPADDHAAPRALRGDVVNSRSRRLRGPPQG